MAAPVPPHPLREIFLSDRPLIDVRAPVEFADGHFPRSINLPLMTDEERHQVGIEYKERGQAAAIELGHRLVGGEVKAARVARWLAALREHPGARLYCFRGGLRSQISAHWVREAGGAVEIVPGGYKALRRFLMEETERLCARFEPVVIAGRTGSGKTAFLRAPGLRPAWIDLEGIARHRGSAFGATGPLGTQPVQITFENVVAIELMKREAGGASEFGGGAKGATLVLEDESRSIGALQIPPALWARMEAAPLVVLERTLAERVRALYEEYVVDKTRFYDGDVSRTREFYLAALDRIERKLGGLQHRRIRGQIVEAFGTDASAPDALSFDRHEGWVASLLEHYYDPLYDRTILRRKSREIFRGDADACREFLNARG